MIRRRVARFLAALACACCVIACGEDTETAPSRPHVSRLRLRIAVADATSAEISFYDVADREIVARLPLDASVETLVASHTGETATVVYRSGGAARVLTSGVSVIPHKDHIHIFKSPPELLGETLVGTGTATASFAAGAWGIFFDGAGPHDGTTQATAAAHALDEEAWLKGARSPHTIANERPHRGFATPFGVDYLVTQASGAEARGDSVKLVSPQSEGTSDAVASSKIVFDCPEIDAAASTGEIAAFACRDGVVLVGSEGATSPIPFPDGTRIRQLEALPSHAIFVGLDPDSGHVVALHAAEKAAKLVPLEGEACAAVLEVGPTPRAVVLTSRGDVERFDLETQRRLSRVAAVAPFSCSDAVRPNLAATPDRAWVTSPTTAELLEVDTHVASLVRRIPLEGVPGAVVALGLDARNAELSTGNDKLTD